MGLLETIIIAIVLFIFFRYFVTVKHKDGTVIHGDTENHSTPIPPAATLEWPAIGDYDFEIVGESHYQPALRRIAGDHDDQSPYKECKAYLIPEADNQHDDKAVRVDIDGNTVGYLTRDDARSFRRRLGAKKLTGQTTSCNAAIVGGFIMKNGERASYGVKLDIKPFAE